MSNKSDYLNLIRRHLIRHGPTESKTLQNLLNISQSYTYKLLQQLGTELIQIKKGKNTLYMLTRAAFNMGDNMPIGQTNRHGNTTIIAYLRPLAHGGFYLQEQPPGMPKVLKGVNRDGIFDGLPYFLDDLRPQGFLGKKIAEKLHNQDNSFPLNPLNWKETHIVEYIVANNESLSSNLKFGQQSLYTLTPPPEHISDQDYSDIADKIMSGNALYPSSSGGEQPKFTVYSKEKNRFVMVKFSPKGDNEIARRWKDILITEHYANRTLRRANLATCESRLLNVGQRLFLESERFDRIGEIGRSSMLSLTAIDAEFVGLGENWVDVMQQLHQQNLIRNEDLIDTEFLWLFGRLINNTDMHLGNLSLQVTGNTFQLLPVYDMCSMGFAPQHGELPELNFKKPKISAKNLKEDAIMVLHDLAKRFWLDVANDQYISSQFRDFITAHIKSDY